MTPKEAEIRLRIMVALMPLSINDKKCQPVIDDLYKIFEISKAPEMLEALKDLQSRVVRCRELLEETHGSTWNILDTQKSESLLKELE